MNEYVGLKPYPENPPEHDGSYLCQIGIGYFDILHWKKGQWFERDWMPFDTGLEAVVGWTDFPEPLKIDKWEDRRPK